MFRSLALLLTCWLLLVPTHARAADLTVVDVTFETCVEGTAVVLKGEACHIQDVAKGRQKMEFTMKFGFFGGLSSALGPEAGVGVSSTLTVKFSTLLSQAKSADEVRKYLSSHPEELAKKIAEAAKGKNQSPPTEADILRILKAPAKPFCSLDNAAFAAMLKKNSCSLDD